MLDDQTKARLKELMFHVVPNPDEEINYDVLAESESVSYDDAQIMKREFRSIIEDLSEYPEVQKTVIEGLDDIEGAGADSGGPRSDVEWMNTCEVIGRRIRKAMQPLLG